MIRHMPALPNPIAKPAARMAFCALVAGAALGGAAQAQQNIGPGAPLEFQPTQLFQFETANQMRAGSLQLSFGSTQSDPGSASGTGNQIYFAGIDYALTDRLTFGIAGQSYEDQVGSLINGLLPTVGMDSFSGSVKYQLYNSGRLKVSAQASAEFFRFESAIVGSITGTDANHVVGSVRVPISYAMSDQLQLHLTPSVSVFPGDINGFDFYGTVAAIGAGVSWKPSQRLAFYGAVNVPVGPGGNTISNTATITNVPVWTVGGRFNITPKGAIDVYATNGIGMTPATSILTFWPDGDTPLVGVRMNWTPGRGEGYRPSYRGIRATALSSRELRLQQDGFTLGSADTFEPGILHAAGWYGTADNMGGGLVLAPDQDGQIEGFIEEYAQDGSVPATHNPSTGPRYMVGAKLRFLDQNNGDPFSLSTRILGGRGLDTGAGRGPGVFYFGLAASYKASPRLTLTANPRVAAFGNTQFYGLGLGANFELFEGLDVIGEVTAMAEGEPMVWAAGARYEVPNTSISIDASASNAIGRYGLGTLIAQDDTKFSLGVSTRFNLRPLRP